jgi:hypothetical protein
MPPVRRGLPNRRDYLTLPSAAEFLQAAIRITGASAAQLASSESRAAAVTSESRPFRMHTLSRPAVRGPVQSLKVARGFMPLSLVSSPRDSTRHGRPGSSGAKTAMPTWIGRAGTDRPPHPAPCRTKSAPEDTSSHGETALKALRLAVCPRRGRAVAKSRYSQPD